MSSFLTCVSRNSDNTCKKLTVPCPGEGCPFCRSKDEVTAERAKADERLRSLGEVGQRYISEKYYAGAQPWRNGGAAG
ncbi:MAG TPA: hypothetical protein VHP31_08290 [Caproicibacter sp.]|nr:hypothetical protein [Caproicibacter sp.]